MAAADLVTLDLHHSPGSELAAVCLRLFDAALNALDEVVPPGEPAVRADVHAQLAKWRAAREAPGRPEALEAAGVACVDAYRRLAKHEDERHSEERREVASLIELVRHAIEASAGEQACLSTTVVQAAARFEAVARLDDLRLIKLRLSGEVDRLKQSVKEREERWQHQLREMKVRVSTLEGQLVTSRLEAGVDPLTQVANRRTFDDRCRELLRTNSSVVALALLDVDDFKSINDAHGHAAGDRVLTALAACLKSSVRADDLVARIGGDEFAVLASGVTLRQAEARFRSVLSAMHTPGQPLVDGLPTTVSLSCGVAEFSAGDSRETLLRRADEALYDAKRAGKNRVVGKPAPYLRDYARR